MDMYETNSRLPRLRMEAVRLVQSGWTVREVARHLGYYPGTITKWVERAAALPSNAHLIPTLSSRPHHHPHELPFEAVERILTLRRERSQCAEILHHRLALEGLIVSLSSVKRTLKRHGLAYPSPWKRWHQYLLRPIPEKPGILVEIDALQEGLASGHLHAYALVDLCSRWGYAEATARLSTHRSLAFVEGARRVAPFSFQVLQSDHGAEFSRWLTSRLAERGIAHRHSRVRTPTDNAHVERFIQTLQRECLRRIPGTLRTWQREIPEYLRYYNTERPHMALGMKTPSDILKVFPSY